MHTGQWYTCPKSAQDLWWSTGALPRQVGRSFTLGPKGNSAFSSLFCCSSATWSSKNLRKGNAELDFSIHICDLSLWPCFLQKIDKGESEGWVQVAVKQLSLNYSWRRDKPFLKTRTWSFNVRFFKELQEVGIDKYVTFARCNEQLWKAVGSQAVSYLKKKYGVWLFHLC